MHISVRELPMGYEPAMTGLVPVIHVVSDNSRRSGPTEPSGNSLHNGRLFQRQE